MINCLGCASVVSLLSSALVHATLDSVFELTAPGFVFARVFIFHAHKRNQQRNVHLKFRAGKKAFTHFPVHLTRSNSQIAALPLQQQISNIK